MTDDTNHRATERSRGRALQPQRRAVLPSHRVAATAALVRRRVEPATFTAANANQKECFVDRRSVEGGTNRHVSTYDSQCVASRDSCGKIPFDTESPMHSYCNIELFLGSPARTVCSARTMLKRALTCDPDKSQASCCEKRGAWKQGAAGRAGCHSRWRPAAHRTSSDVSCPGCHHGTMCNWRTSCSRCRRRTGGYRTGPAQVRVVAVCPPYGCTCRSHAAATARRSAYSRWSPTGIPSH